eukprot:1094937-Pleurochrysis_carterae.AAC.1
MPTVPGKEVAPERLGCASWVDANKDTPSTGVFMRTSMSSQPKGHYAATDKSAEHTLVQYGCTQQTTKQHHRTRY